jgi:hypothetical protein
MNLKKSFPYIILIILAIVAIALRNCKSSTTKTKTTTTTTTDDDKNYGGRGLNRNPSHINYSKHARCRMGCRHIDDAEVKDMLVNGTINYKKSELQGEDCKKKYAVEGTSKDGQRLRIIFAPCGDEVTVVTCIDIKEEWDCPDCN